MTSTEKQEEPFGPGIAQALDFLLNKGKNDGFSVKNVDGYAGHIEAGEGKDLLGILCHVDVVPEGDGWSVDPYGGEIKDGKIFARGAIDDKGPTMAAYYAMKIVKDLGLPLSKRVRMIIERMKKVTGDVWTTTSIMKRCQLWDLRRMRIFLSFLLKKALQT